jgi:hypothetical protein
MTNNMKTPIEYIIVAVPFHADAATHDETGAESERKTNRRLRTVWRTVPQRGNDVSGHDEADSPDFPTPTP